MFELLWKTFGRRASFALDAETAHGLAIKGLKTGGISGGRAHSDERLNTSVAGLNFHNPIGVAAGFDKNAEVPDALLAIGFGFTEVGTITPLAQTGNPKPRVFRLPKDQGVINRLGFNNEGHDRALERLQTRAGKSGIVGVNVGANKDSDDRANDYVLGIRAFYSHADYFTVNISSPNTPGLRDLQAKDQLASLLDRVLEARIELAGSSNKNVPVFLKIAPDVSENELDDITQVVLDKRIEGMIVSNTTLDRTSLKFPTKEAGGLSGKPLMERSTIMLAKTRRRVGKELPIIGVGGVDDAQSAFEKISAGADLVQLYSGMIYQGPTIANVINRGLSKILDQHSANTIADMRDVATDDWANRPIG